MILDRPVTVCDRCLQASCWQGLFMCDESRNAGTVDKTIRELAALGYESPDFWFVAFGWQARYAGARGISSGGEMTILDVENIEWHDVTDSMPDADTTVIVYAKEADEPVALGYFDGSSWFEYSGMEYGNEDEIAAPVVAWATMPVGATATARDPS